VLDTGAALGHPDLAPNLWTNSGEIPGNGRDDDANGYVDDVHGVNVLAKSGDPSDDEGHGTHVAGIVGARSSNGIGVAGVAGRVRLMIVKVLDDRRAGTAATLAEGVRYALRNGAHVINASVNGDGRSHALEDAIRAADAAGTTIVTSAGNDGRNLDVLPSYPASYPHDNVLGVGASSRAGAPAAFSNFGARAIEVTAPGEDILATARGGGYELRTGTSMAAPQVTGTLALLHAAAPGSSGAERRRVLLDSARRLPVLAGLVGAGALDMAAALRQIVPADVWRGSQAPPALTIAVPSPRRAGVVTVRWAGTGDLAGIATVRVFADGRLIAEQAPDAPAAVPVRLGRGLHLLRVEALDAIGNISAEVETRIRLTNAAKSKPTAKAKSKTESSKSKS